MSGLFTKKILPTMPTIGAPKMPQVEAKPFGMPFGIDIYHNDKDWTKMRLDFIFIKATEGDSHVDSKFSEWRATARGKGLPCGAYHFLRGGDIKPQIDRFLQTIGYLQTGELPCVLDWEARDAKSVSDAATWLQAVEAKTGITPIIYSSHSFLIEKNLPDSFAKYPLWIARPGSDTPFYNGKLPRPWNTWAFWQKAFGENGSASGFDENVYNGSIEDMKKFYVKK